MTLHPQELKIIEAAEGMSQPGTLDVQALVQCERVLFMTETGSLLRGIPSGIKGGQHPMLNVRMLDKDYGAVSVHADAVLAVDLPK